MVHLVGGASLDGNRRGRLGQADPAELEQRRFGALGAHVDPDHHRLAHGTVPSVEERHLFEARGAARGVRQPDLKGAAVPTMERDEVVDRPLPGGVADAVQHEQGGTPFDPEQACFPRPGHVGLDAPEAGDDRKLVLLSQDPVERCRPAQVPPGEPRHKQPGQVGRHQHVGLAVEEAQPLELHHRLAGREVQAAGYGLTGRGLAQRQDPALDLLAAQGCIIG